MDAYFDDFETQIQIEEIINEDELDMIEDYIKEHNEDDEQ